MDKDQLQAGNTMIQGTAILNVFVGPALAGALIGLNITVLLVCAGVLMTLFTLSAASSPAVRVGMD